MVSIKSGRRACYVWGLILIAIRQSILGGGTLWLPAFVRRREIGRDRVERGLDKARRPIKWIDRLLKPRLTGVAAGKASRWAISVTAALLAIAFFPLNLIPYAVTVPALGVLALGRAHRVRPPSGPDRIRLFGSNGLPAIQRLLTDRSAPFGGGISLIPRRNHAVPPPV